MIQGTLGDDDALGAGAGPSVCRPRTAGNLGLVLSIAEAICLTRDCGTASCSGLGPITFSDSVDSLVVAPRVVRDRLSRDPSGISDKSNEGGISTRPGRSRLTLRGGTPAEDARDELGVGVCEGRPGALVRPQGPADALPDAPGLGWIVSP